MFQRKSLTYLPYNLLCLSKFVNIYIKPSDTSSFHKPLTIDNDSNDNDDVSGDGDDDNDQFLNM
jgi:hypothetical protein